jgi:hypothetical protein
MISDKGEAAKQLQTTTREQLIDQFALLLDDYERGIISSTGAKPAPPIQSGEIQTVPVMEAGVPESKQLEAGENAPCDAVTKKLLNTVVGKWRQLESTAVPLSPKTGKNNFFGLSVVWARDIYHEWELTTCALTANHKGNHGGNKRVVYSPLSTVTIKQEYGENDPVKPPAQHFTNSMPGVEPDDNSTMHPDDLPKD